MNLNDTNSRRLKVGERSKKGDMVFVNGKWLEILCFSGNVINTGFECRRPHPVEKPSRNDLLKAALNNPEAHKKAVVMARDACARAERETAEIIANLDREKPQAQSPPTRTLFVKQFANGTLGTTIYYSKVDVREDRGEKLIEFREVTAQ